MRKYMREVGSTFVNGGEYAQAATCSVWGDVFYSYDTPIAVRKDGMFYLTEEKISPTTSGQQNALKALIPSGRLVVISTEDIAVMAK